jgi:hypothetical protein
MVFSPATEALGPAVPPEGAANRLLADMAINKNKAVSNVAKAQTRSPWIPSLNSASSGLMVVANRSRNSPPT